MNITKKFYGTAPDGTAVDLYTLQNDHGGIVSITNYGGIVVSWLTPNRQGTFDDIVLGFDTFDGFLSASPYSYFGALIGRYGNRIGQGKFTLNGVEYTLVLAIIEIESGYRWNASCKEGSTGYMQVLPKWHEERMHRLNVDNVENPYFNVLVGVDYLAELQERFGTEAEVLTAYNYGVAGAYEHVWNKGLTETEYSREVQQAKERIERRMRGEW